MVYLLEGEKGSHHYRSNFHSASASGGSTGMFHTPGKRRRTKVTDTRLSPRNAPALRAGLLAANIMQQQSQLGDKKQSFGSMICNNDNNNDGMDDQENLDMDSDTNNNNNNSQDHMMMMRDQDENDSRSSDNENGGGGGQLATMPNGYPSSYDNNMMNELGSGGAGSSSNDYSGYPMSFMSSKSNKNNDNNDVTNRSSTDSPWFVEFQDLFVYLKQLQCLFTFHVKDISIMQFSSFCRSYPFSVFHSTRKTQMV